MHKFLVKSVRGNIVHGQASKKALFDKLLKMYETADKSFYIVIEEVSKDINAEQERFYRAFILEACKHFGNTYPEMEILLSKFYPIDVNGNKKPLQKWNTEELNNYISQSTSLLSDFGFKF